MAVMRDRADRQSLNLVATITTTSITTPNAAISHIAMRPQDYFLSTARHLAPGY
jgi:hypothetical protein